MKKSDGQGAISTFVTLRIVGDELDPRSITQLVHVAPTLAHRRGETISSARTGKSRIAKFGMWYFSTREATASRDLADHLLYLARNILLESLPLADAPVLVSHPNQRLQDLVTRGALTLVVTAFWRGRAKRQAPKVPNWFPPLVHRYGGRMELDFSSDTERAQQLTA